jgi:antitoxin component YwqK of YwqJK toxin-antitoxin module
MKCMASSEVPRLILTGLLCVSLACATATPPAPHGAKAPGTPPAADTASQPSAPAADSAPAPDPAPAKPDPAAKTDSRAKPATQTASSQDPADDDDTDPAPPKTSGKKKPATQAQRVRQSDMARRAEAGLESMIIGTVIGAQFGGIGAIAGAAVFGMYGIITGDVPFDSGRRNQPQSGGGGGGGGHPRGNDEEMENEVDQELKKQEDLEAEIEAELKHQEELLAAINKQEEINKTLQQESKDCAGSAPADATAAPKRPCQRDIPDSIFETKTVKDGKRELIVKTLDADRDGKPEVKITIDAKTGQVLTREEDTDFDGTLDAVNTYLPDGRLKERAEDTNQDRKPDRWLIYDGNETAQRVEVDRNFDGKRDGFLQYQNGVLAYEEYDNNNDGKIDRRIEYVNGKRHVEIEDTNLNGVMDSRTYFDDKGVLTRVERDKNEDGKPDVIEYFEGTDPAKVVLVKREEDTNGDGIIDVTSYYEKGKLVRKEVADPNLVN